MLPYRDSRVVSAAIIAFFLLAIGYGVFEAQGLLFGPHIDVPSVMQQVRDPFVTISGKTERIASLTMQGQPIDVTEKGAFSEPYLLTPGLNRIELVATDKYGHTSRKVLQIVYTPATSTTALPTATTTATTSPATLGHSATGEASTSGVAQ